MEVNQKGNIKKRAKPNKRKRDTVESQTQTEKIAKKKVEDTGDDLTEWDVGLTTTEFKENPTQEKETEKIEKTEKTEEEKAKAQDAKREKRRKERHKAMDKHVRQWENIQYSPKEKQLEFFWTKLKEAYLKEQSLIDLNDKIQDTAFVQLTQTKNFDTSSLPNALEELYPGIKSQKMLIAGSPLIIIIAGANLRVIEIAKSLRKVGPKFVVTEVFSKHKTLTEHVELLYTVCPTVVVGTIERIQKLVLAKALNLDSCKLLVFDMVRDQKTFCILDRNESKRPIFELYWHHFHAKVKEDKVKLLLY